MVQDNISSNKIKENKYKILRMSLLLGNGEDREDTINNFEDASRDIDAMNDEIYLKDLEGKFYDTLTLEEDDKGLHVRINPPDTQWAKDLLVSIKRGDITQMSFGFTVILDRWNYEDNTDVRELLKVKLYDVSPVTFPAYTQTECGIRSAYDNHQKEVVKAKELAKQKLDLRKQKLKFIGD